MGCITDRSAPDTSFEALVQEMPQLVRDALPLVRWHLDQLWALRLPVHRIKVDDLNWLLDLPLWQLDGRRFQVSPNEVARDPDRFPAHLHRAMRSDLAHPIHLVEHNGRWVILDGYHRLLKAVLLNQRTVLAMRLSSDDLASVSN